MSSKPAPSPEILRSHEAAFIEHYRLLIRWALHLTNNDRAHAEDLVQEVFAQLAFRHTDLADVQNIPGYLYTTLRNLHVSEMRIAGRSHIQSPSVVEYNLADTALSSSNPHDLYQTQDQLRRICYYAYVRKQSSRAGSVMILRFFFGYHLSEVAQVLGGTCQAIRQCLRFARNEAQAFLDDPGSLSFIDRAQTVKTISVTPVCGPEELLADLRLAIFRSREGACLDSDVFNALYKNGLIQTANNSTLAHIVSCRHCLDSANRALNLPLLAERHPADSLGPDNSSRGGPGASGGSGGVKHDVRRPKKDRDEDITSSFLLRCRRRARELFEHHPRELCVSVNGYVLGSQWVSSEISRLRLDITIPEPLSFIEVMSGENARLLVMTVDAPPSGEPTQTRHVVLSEGRHVEATLRYGHPWPMLEVVYRDPSFTAESLVSASEAGGTRELKAAPDLPTVVAAIVPHAGMDHMQANRLQNSSILQRLTQTGKTFTGVIGRSQHRNLTRGSFNFSRGVNLIRPFWSRPSFITAILSMFLIGVLLFLRFSITPAVSAANLIERASAAEQTLDAATGRAVHRVVTLEERVHAGGALIARQRIEILRDPQRGLKVRRVYDDKGRLIGGEWITTHSQIEGLASRTVYHPGETPRIESAVRNPHAAIQNVQLWQLEPSAKEYAEMIGRADAARVSEDANVYVVAYAGAPAVAGSTLLEATLTLRKSDLHPIEQTLLLQRGSETREYRLIEASFERPPALAPEALVVNPELLSENVKAEIGTKKRENDSVPSPSSVPPSPIVATADLEVEVAYLLDQFRTRFGDQITLTRTAEGLLRIEGVADTDQSKQEILRALSPVISNPAITIRISTVTEALARQQRRSASPSITHEFSASENAMPAYADLRRYFSGEAKGSLAKDDRVEQEVLSFAARVVGRSRRVLSHAIELRQLKQRFSAAQLSVLTPTARARWFGMVRNHAEIFEREASLLDQELGPIFSPGTPGSEIAGIEISNEADLATAVEHLYKLAIANDEVIRSAFTASSEPSAVTILKGRRFYVSLATTQKLAEKIRQAAISLNQRE